MSTKIKNLCICAGGVVRSVTLANVLRLFWKQEALAAGVSSNEPQTIVMLCEWADRIWITQDWMWEYMPAEYHHKIKLLDLGEDVWGMSNHPELHKLCYRVLEKELGPDRREKTYDEIVAHRDAVMKSRWQSYSGKQSKQRPTKLF